MMALYLLPKKNVTLKSTDSEIERNSKWKKKGSLISLFASRKNKKLAIEVPSPKKSLPASKILFRFKMDLYTLIINSC